MDISARLKKIILGVNAPQEVPETGFSNDLIQRKDTHAVDLGVGVRLSGQVTADDLVFRDGHLYCPSEPLAPRTKRNADVGGDCLEDGGRIDQWMG